MSLYTSTVSWENSSGLCSMYETVFDIRLRISSHFDLLIFSMSFDSLTLDIDSIIFVSPFAIEYCKSRVLMALYGLSFNILAAPSPYLILNSFIFLSEDFLFAYKPIEMSLNSLSLELLLRPTKDLMAFIIRLNVVLIMLGRFLFCMPFLECNIKSLYSSARYSSISLLVASFIPTTEFRTLSYTIILLFLGKTINDTKWNASWNPVPFSAPSHNNIESPIIAPIALTPLSIVRMWSYTSTAISLPKIDLIHATS